MTFYYLLNAQLYLEEGNALSLRVPMLPHAILLLIVVGSVLNLVHQFNANVTLKQLERDRLIASASFHDEASIHRCNTSFFTDRIASVTGQALPVCADLCPFDPHGLV